MYQVRSWEFNVNTWMVTDIWHTQQNNGRGTGLLVGLEKDWQEGKSLFPEHWPASDSLLEPWCKMWAKVVQKWTGNRRGASRQWCQAWLRQPCTRQCARWHLPYRLAHSAPPKNPTAKAHDVDPGSSTSTSNAVTTTVTAGVQVCWSVH